MERGKPCFALCPHTASLLGKGFLGCLTSQPSYEIRNVLMKDILNVT